MTSSTGAGALLQHYLRASDAAEAELYLSPLLYQQAEPLILRIVQSRLLRRANPDRGYLEDVCSEAMVELVSSLDRLRESPAIAPIENFEAYVTTIANRACSEHFRRRYPMFHRLRNRLRYALRASPSVGIWQNETGEWFCGKSLWQPAPGKPALTPLRTFLGGGEEGFPGLKPEDPNALFSAVFGRAGAPIAFDDLVRITARCWAVSDAYDSLDSDSISLADPAPLPDASAEKLPWLRNLWREILDLPANQRSALLLNLRDESGECATAVFVATGVASLSDLAKALEIPPQEFAALWRGMPMDDFQIAERLGIKRQQVINLRKCAKERLARRMQRVSQ
jgi:RNA polymerase sigma factor (sigma-70 family)